MSVKVVTFGCRLNISESEQMEDHARAAGLENTIIVNTCAVTAEAERQAKQTIRRLKRTTPGSRILVTGCAAEINPGTYRAMAEVDDIVPNHRKLSQDAFAPRQDGPRTPSMFEKLETKKREEGDLQRAFVQVQNGCDHRCTFCIIPFGRGASRSMAMGEIVDQVRTKLDQGYNEIVFTGVDLTSYGLDLPGRPSLGQMIRRVLALLPQLPRLRLSSLDPAAFDEELFRLIGEEPRLMPHLHLSIQAGDDIILKRMKRRHLRSDVFKLVERARSLRKDIVFGADFITGFPTETDAMFENTLNLIQACELTWLHVFPYSSRAGTPAARMPQLPAAIRRQRAQVIRDIGTKADARHKAGLTGQVIEVLCERRGLGCTPHFAKISLTGEAPLGGLVKAEIGRSPTGEIRGRVRS